MKEWILFQASYWKSKRNEGKGNISLGIKEKTQNILKSKKIGVIDVIMKENVRFEKPKEIRIKKGTKERESLSNCKKE